VVAQIAQRTDLPPARPPKPEKKKKKAPPAVTDPEVVAVAEARRYEAAKAEARALRAIAKDLARDARTARSRVLLQTTSAADARRVLGEFRSLFGIRRMAVEAKPQSGRAWSISAWLERENLSADPCAALSGGEP
jgi:hypothetical protein